MPFLDQYRFAPPPPPPVLMVRSAYIKASHVNVLIPKTFGMCAVHNGTLVVGAPNEPSNATGIDGDQTDTSVTAAGSAYAFTKVAGVWTQQAYIKPSANENSQNFGGNGGQSVAVYGDTIAVAALNNDSNATGIDGDQFNSLAPDSGAVYVFLRTAGVWAQQAFVKASNTETSDKFGYSVALYGDTLVVGAYFEDSNATGIGGNEADNSALSAGAVYVFTRSAGVWSQQAYIKASNTEAGDRFGQSVSIYGDTLVVGAPDEDSNATGIGGNEADNSVSNAGAVYVFTRTGIVWTQQAYIKPSSTPGIDENFGLSVSISGDTLAVGSTGEASNATGIGGDESDNSLAGSGATYVFTRTGIVWTQQAYIKASNTGASDRFGTSIAIDGDRLVVGAHGEDSNATNLNGNQASNSLSGSGAAYMFNRVAGVWSQKYYIKGFATNASDELGGGTLGGVAISGDILVAGAGAEDSNAIGIDGNEFNNLAGGAGCVYAWTVTGLV